jgi:hypothetical protein
VALILLTPCSTRSDSVVLYSSVALSHGCRRRSQVRARGKSKTPPSLSVRLIVRGSLSLIADPAAEHKRVALFCI